MAQPLNDEVKAGLDRGVAALVPLVHEGDFLTLVDRVHEMSALDRGFALVVAAGMLHGHYAAGCNISR
jgi:hypothetical protein